MVEIDKKIIIRKTEHIHSQNAPNKIVKDVLIKETEYHKEDVYNMMLFISDLIEDAGKNHDSTKLKFFDMFFKDCLAVQENPELNFKDLDWYNLHCNQERHHINSNIPHNVNLIDIMELVVDSVAAGLARSGKLSKEYFMIDPEVLQQSVWNTALMLNDHCQVLSDKDMDDLDSND